MAIFNGDFHRPLDRNWWNRMVFGDRVQCLAVIVARIILTMHMLNNGSSSPQFVPVDELASHPALKRINWTVRMLVTMIRSEVIHGHFDTTTKTWFTTYEEVKSLLEFRNEQMSKRMLDLDDFGK